MAPNEQTLADSYSETNHINKPSKVSTECLKRTISDFSFGLVKESNTNINQVLPPTPEIEHALCECCGMSEECTPKYIHQVQDMFSGKIVCGLCAEAVKEEMKKNGRKTEEALNEHMSECISFNRICRAYPVLCQAEAMRDILKKSSSRLEGRRASGARAKSMRPADYHNGSGPGQVNGGISRSSSCIPANTRDIGDRTMVS